MGVRAFSQKYDIQLYIVTARFYIRFFSEETFLSVFPVGYVRRRQDFREIRARCRPIGGLRVIANQSRVFRHSAQRYRIRTCVRFNMTRWK
ncbi:hypothetical protein FA04_07715 [Ensifer adhaerens]|nr:hypothetical protein FA04_07715 [Ensifer adhaerens]KDP74763.1 hypothetical protein FA04_05115 [Ensifer adhaerens]